MIPDSLGQLKEARAKTLEKISECSQEDFDRCPAKSGWNLGEAGKWSIGELADHIVRIMTSLTSEIGELIELSVRGEKPSLTRGFKDYDVSPSFVPKKAMPYLEPFFKLATGVAMSVPSFRKAFIRSRHFPIQNPTQWLPEGGHPADELRERLKNSMLILDSIFDAHSEIDYNELVLTHSVFGRHTVPELLDTMTMHEEWHHPDFDALIPEKAAESVEPETAEA
ncbi:MAG: hypothetical protein ACI8UO_001334 [Verrucomicrobiales bacterium]|jgi:hypothetical protein